MRNECEYGYLLGSWCYSFEGCLLNWDRDICGSNGKGKFVKIVLIGWSSNLDLGSKGESKDVWFCRRNSERM